MVSFILADLPELVVGGNLSTSEEQMIEEENITKSYYFIGSTNQS